MDMEGGGEEEVGYGHAGRVEEFIQGADME